VKLVELDTKLPLLGVAAVDLAAAVVDTFPSVLLDVVAVASVVTDDVVLTAGSGVFATFVCF